MAVVLRVPTDVLTEIFHLLCKKSIFVCELNNSCCKDDFPWAVGLVCRQWRTAFLSYPPIWASLKLSDRYYDPSRIAHPETRSEIYAKEISRRLALYLERSGRHPLRLDILLWSSHNKSFTLMVLEMLSACSHRWQSAKIDLSCDWQLDSLLPCKGKLPTLEWLDIRSFALHKRVRGIFEVAPRLTHAHVVPWTKEYGWILPWTQLTELILISNGDCNIEDGDILNLLPMLHNIKELRFRFDFNEIDFEDGFHEFAPTPLNQLRVLEISHPDILSWFVAPSLCEIYFADHQEDYDYDEPLDVQGEISSLIQRSGCRIRKLSFQSGGEFYVGTLKDVEELVIDSTLSGGRPYIDISSLPNLRLLTIICRINESFESSMVSLISALDTASEGSSGSLLERVTVELQYRRELPEIPKSLLGIAKKWPMVVFRTQRS